MPLVLKAMPVVAQSSAGLEHGAAEALVRQVRSATVFGDTVFRTWDELALAVRTRASAPAWSVADWLQLEVS